MPVLQILAIPCKPAHSLQQSTEQLNHIASQLHSLRSLLWGYIVEDSQWDARQENYYLPLCSFILEDMTVDRLEMYKEIKHLQRRSHPLTEPDNLVKWSFSVEEWPLFATFHNHEQRTRDSKLRVPNFELFLLIRARSTSFTHPHVWLLIQRCLKEYNIGKCAIFYTHERILNAAEYCCLLLATANILGNRALGSIVWYTSFLIWFQHRWTWFDKNKWNGISSCMVPTRWRTTYSRFDHTLALRWILELWHTLEIILTHIRTVSKIYAVVMAL